MKPFCISLLIILIGIGPLRAQYDTSGPAQDLRIRVDRQSSGSGHLNMTNLGASFKSGRSSFYGGVILVEHLGKVEGFKASYRFFPFSFGARILPYFQYELFTRLDARLTPELEEIVHREGWKRERKERYHTLEHYLGFGVHVPMTWSFYLDLGIGMGLYHSRLSSDFDDRIEYPQRFRKAMDASLTLRGGFGYTF
ncbi:MAG: hypothetical protein ABEH38_07710 [Flavobacteriales bacterium]